MAITAAGVATGAKVQGSSTVSASSVSLTSGQLLLVWLFRWNSTTSTAPVAGDLTKASGTATLGTITMDKQVTMDNGGSMYDQAALFSAVVTGSGTAVMQISNGNSGAYQCIAVEAFNPDSGKTWGSSRVDGTPASNTDPGETWTSFSTGNVTTTGAGIIAACIQVDSGDDGTITEDGAFSLVYESQTGSTDDTGSAIHRIVSTGTTDSGDWTLSFSVKYGLCGVAVAYKQEASGSFQPAWATGATQCS